MRFTHSRVRPSARYDGCRRVARFSFPLYAVDGGANGERFAFLPVGRFLHSFLLLSHSSSCSFSLPQPLLLLSLPHLVLSKGSGRYLEENSLSSLATREIPVCTSIAGKRGWFGEVRRKPVGSRGGVKVRNVAGREIASFPNPLCVFWLDWPSLIRLRRPSCR